VVEKPASTDAGFLHLLRSGDPAMSALVRRLGPLGHEARRRGRPDDAYGSLVRSIVGQQLSTKAARSIYARITGFFGGRAPSPEEMLAVSEETLRSCGLSGRKVLYLRDLTARVLNGSLDLEELEKVGDEEVRSRITAVKGLGPWSADMFLIFHLGRPDVLPVGDLGIRRAAARIYGLATMPGPEELEELARPWRPHRSLACLYLWESLDMDAIPGS
jgi:DNA-3-methyladenine glycosylase II